jgi:hypothetical protein
LATEQEEQSLDAALSIDSVKLDLVEGPASMSTSCEPGVQQALEEGLGFSIGYAQTDDGLELLLGQLPCERVTSVC